MSDHSETAVIIVAAGKGTRLGGVPKQHRRLAGSTVLARTIRSFLRALPGAMIQVVIGGPNRARYDAALQDFGEQDRARLLVPVEGGETRQDSVRNGLECLMSQAPEIVLIHDAARPFASDALILRAREAAIAHGAAVPGVAATDTLKSVGPDGVVTQTHDRDSLRAIQTPQAFRYDLILAAHRAEAGAQRTDDAAVAEAAGHSVHVFEGEATNVKITTAEDFQAAEARLGGALTDVRIGQGYDVHAYGPGDTVWFGGVAIPHDRGLSAHSDGDVVAHAITDAILGALADGDIGAHFPPSDPQWKGAASSIFLADAASRVRAKGGVIANVDATVICERPKVGPHRDAIRARLAEIMGIDIGRVAIKATTSKRLGFTGREEGVVAMAIATIRLPEGA